MNLALKKVLETEKPKFGQGVPVGGIMGRFFIDLSCRWAGCKEAEETTGGSKRRCRWRQREVT
jgi:hypothetical protein